MATAVVLLHFPAVALAEPSRCDVEWLTRTPKPISPEDAKKICSRKAALLNPAAVVCTGDGDVEHYKKALAAACSHPDSETSTPEWRTLLQVYMANGNSLQLTVAQAQASEVIQNATPFLPSGAAPVAGASISSPIAGVVAQGIADFLVSRAEAEVSLFASQEFFSKLCGDAAIEPYFDKTCTLMKDIDKGTTIAEPPSLGTLRNALIKDLQALPKQVIKKVLQNAPAGSSTQVLGCALDVTYAVAQSMQAHEDPWQTLVATQLDPPAGLYVHATDTTHCKGEWKAIADAAKVLRGEQNAPTTGFSRLRKGDALGLVPELKTADLAALTVQQKVVRRMAPPIARMFAVNEQMAFSGNVSEGGVREIIGAVFRAVAEALKVADCNSVEGDCSKAIDEARDIATELTEAQWSAAVMTFLTAAELRGAVFKGAPALASIFAAVAAVAEAKDSDGVQAALDSFAAPVGSWRRKHEASGMGILGLAGANWSQEFVLNSKSRGGTLTPTLSIGLDMYFPSSLLFGKPDTFRVGFQVPIIDVGNFASVRYDADSEKDVVHAKTTPDIEVSQLFAPGLYAFTSIGKSPFVLAGGCSWIPALRTVTEDNLTSQHAVVRCGGTLAVDVTIMPLLKFK